MESRKFFGRFGLMDRVHDTLSGLGYQRPTKVQEKVIPLFLQGYNLIVEAPTGTGKTAAYGLPLISKLNLQKRSTQALVMLPTRELALQVAAALSSFYAGNSLKVGTVHGGVPLEESFSEIKAAPHILVVVPGRLRDVMGQYKYDFLWRDIRFVIADEGDKLLEMGFQREFDSIRQNVRKTAQFGFFSATISSDSEALVRERIPHIKTIRLSPNEMLQSIKFGYVKSPGKREKMLSRLIDQYAIRQALIFCAKRDHIQVICNYLRNHGLMAEAYYGSQEQHERANILSRFKEGHIQFLVASDLAARGLDVPDLPVVVNLSMPKEFEYYLHRVGRTGRAGKTGQVFNLINSEAEEIYMKNHHKKIRLPIRWIELSSQQQEQVVPSEEKWMKYHLSRGKKDKIRKGDIVGFLVHNASLSPESIGTITIYDSYSIVDIPQSGFTTLNQRKEGLKIKGKSLKIRPFQSEEQTKRAKAVKSLLKNKK